MEWFCNYALQQWCHLIYSTISAALLQHSNSDMGENAQDNRCDLFFTTPYKNHTIHLINAGMQNRTCSCLPC